MTSSDDSSKQKLKVFEACPHCGHKLSPWQQVLLGVDRALTCKNCWYRIILDLYEEEPPKDEINREGKNKEDNKE